jgi:hypothetical protein
MKNIITSILIAATLIGGAIILNKKNNSADRGFVDNDNIVEQNNVRIENGIQIVDIRARGGYQPRQSQAKAGIPTILRFDSKGTFDCSASVRIPSKKISRSLDFSGSTDIDIGIPEVGVMLNRLR